MIIYNNPRAYYHRGIMYYEQGEYCDYEEGEYPKTIADLTEVIDLSTDDHDKAMAYYHRSIAYEAHGKHEEAEADYRRANKLIELIELIDR